MLIRTCQLVKKGCLSAVLISHQRIAQKSAGRKRLSVPFRVIPSVLTQTRMLLRVDFFNPGMRIFSLGNIFDLDSIRVRKPEGQLIPVNLKLHGIAQRRELHHSDFGTGNDSHVQEMLAQSPVSTDFFDHSTLSDFQVS